MCRINGRRAIPDLLSAIVRIVRTTVGQEPVIGFNAVPGLIGEIADFRHREYEAFGCKNRVPTDYEKVTDQSS